MRIAKIFVFLVCLFGFLSGCTQVPVKKYSPPRKNWEPSSIGDLKGLDKVEIIKRFGQPLATSQSDVSESWYYAQPCELWIWFTQDKVVRWETK